MGYDMKGFKWAVVATKDGKKYIVEKRKEKKNYKRTQLFYDKEEAEKVACIRTRLYGKK